MRNNRDDLRVRYSYERGGYDGGAYFDKLGESKELFYGVGLDGLLDIHDNHRESEVSISELLIGGSGSELYVGDDEVVVIKTEVGRSVTDRIVELVRDGKVCYIYDLSEGILNVVKYTELGEGGKVRGFVKRKVKALNVREEVALWFYGLGEGESFEEMERVFV